jgi:hypothetical protein
MRGPSFRIQIRWSLMKRECNKHTYKAFRTIISLKIKLLHFSLKITTLRNRRCFKRWNIFVEAFNSMIKDIHLALEVKIFFGNSMPATGSSTESSSQKPGVPTNSHQRHRWKRGKEGIYTQQLKAKLERLRSARLIHRDQAVRLLDMQMLQPIKTF